MQDKHSFHKNIKRIYFDCITVKVRELKNSQLRCAEVIMCAVYGTWYIATNATTLMLMDAFSRLILSSTESTIEDLSDVHPIQVSYDWVDTNRL